MDANVDPKGVIRVETTNSTDTHVSKEGLYPEDDLRCAKTVLPVPVPISVVPSGINSCSIETTDEISSPVDGGEQQSIESSPTSPVTPTRQHTVRFRSRVRITSGLHHHGHSQRRQKSESEEEDVSPQSKTLHRRFSASYDDLSDSSPSSSISAPLRSHENSAQNSRWGSLGQRIHRLRKSKQKRFAEQVTRSSSNSVKRRRRQTYGYYCGTCSKFDCGQVHSVDEVTTAAGASTEHTPLLGRIFIPPRLPLPSSSLYHSISGSGVAVVNIERDLEDEIEDQEARLNREIDAIFGKWPGRLLNRHWWWWQMEPIVRCACLDESDNDRET